MGIVQNWASGYNGTVGSIDDTTTNFPINVDGVHDVMASHVNALAAAVIELQTVQTSLITGTTLQSAYDNDETITMAAGTPITITTAAIGENAFTISDGTNQTDIRAGQVLADNGSVTEPGLSFRAQPTTGFHRGAVNALSAVVEGNLAMRWRSLADDGDGVTLGTEVYLNADAQTTNGDGFIGLDVDIDLPAAPPATPGTQYIFRGRTGGVERMAIDRDGRVLAHQGGTTDPGLSFVGNETTGFSAPGTVINFIINGTREAFMQGNHFTPGADGGMGLGLSTVGWTHFYGRTSGGSVGGPTFSWASDTDTGFYKPAADIVAATAGGVEVARFDGTGASPQVVATDGTPALPSYTFSSQENTGLYLNAVNDLHITVGGAPRFTISPTAFSPSGTKSSGNISNYWTRFWVESAEGGTTSGPSAAAYDLNETGTDAGAYAIGVNTSLLANTSGTTTDLMSTLDELDAAISAAGGGSTLQAAYNSGNTISLAASTPVAVTTSGVGQDGITVTDGVDTTTIRGGQVLAPSGSTAGAPSYAFEGGVGFSNCGMYMSSANIIRWSTGGSVRLQLRGTFFGRENPIDLGSTVYPWPDAYIDRTLHDDGSIGAPSYTFRTGTGVGLYRPAANQLGLAANSAAVIVDNDSTTPSFRPDADNVWTLGESSLRWADIFVTTTSVGDLIMHDPDEGEASPFLILREAHETIEVYDVQANKKFVVPLQEVEMTPEDQARIDAARAKFYGDNN